MFKLFINTRSVLIKNIIKPKQNRIKFYSDLTLDQQEYVGSLFKGVINNQRSHLAKAITLIETSSPKKKILSQKLLNNVLFCLKEKKNKNLNPCLRVG